MNLRRIHRRTLSLAAVLVTSAVAALALASTESTERRADEPRYSAEASSDNDNDHAAPALQACGTPGAPPCPLQAWMRANVGAPLAANKMAALADGLDRAAMLSPDPSWASWATIAANGAQAARRGDVAGARASCKGCHDAWRSAYKEKYRARPIPR